MAKDLQQALEYILNFRDRLLSCGAENVMMNTWGESEYCGRYFNRDKPSMVQSSYQKIQGSGHMLSVAISRDLDSYFEPYAVRGEDGKPEINENGFNFNVFANRLKEVLSHPKVGLTPTDEGKVAPFAPANTFYAEFGIPAQHYQRGMQTLDMILDPNRLNDPKELAHAITDLYNKSRSWLERVSDHLPESWRDAAIESLKKRGKDRTSPD